jgi:N-acyl-L-homoserine lactone synthetase
MRRGRPHPALTDYRLCKEFGWTVEELERQPSKKIQEFLIILAEIDRQTQQEIDKAKRESGSQRGFRG